VHESVLQSALEANMHAFWRDYGNGPGARMHETADLVWFSTACASPAGNRVFLARMDRAEARGAFDEIDRIAVAERKHFQWLVLPGTKPDDLVQHLRSRRAQRIGEVPGMVAGTADMPPATEIPGFRIERVEGIQQQRLWARLAASASGWDQAAAFEFERLEASFGLSVYETRPRFIGYLDDRPVATSALVLEAGVAGLYAVATLPLARRRGIGSEMTAAPLRMLDASRWPMATLQSSPLGLGVYERLGFRRICQFELYLQRPHLQS
jgi:ribosomal protein S18 acetylase RimI-like enzyme